MRSMLKLKSWLEKEWGRATALAKALNVPQSFVTKMASGERPIPVAHMAEIERLTGGELTRAEMFGDGWQKIWPELADPSAARSCAAMNSEESATNHPTPAHPAAVEAAAAFQPGA